MNTLQDLQQKQIELQNYIYQRQALELQLNEINSALEEIEDSKESYELIANIMIKRSSERIKEKLNEKKELLEFKIKSIKNIEKKLEQEIEELRKKANDELSK